MSKMQSRKELNIDNLIKVYEYVIKKRKNEVLTTQLVVKALEEELSLYKRMQEFLTKKEGEK